VSAGYRQALSLSFKAADLLVMVASFVVAAAVVFLGSSWHSLPRLLTVRLKPGNLILFLMLMAAWYVIFNAFGLFAGYMIGLASLAIAILKPIFPDNVGIWMRDGIPVSAGALFPAPPAARGLTLAGGYAVIPLFLGLGLVLLLVTHSLARQWIGRIRARRQRNGPVSTR